MTFTLTNSPISTHTLAVDQPLMLANDQYYYTALGKDHQIVLGHSANATPGQPTLGEGRHMQVTFLEDTANPTLQTADMAIGMIWMHLNDLFFRNATIGPVQLTDSASGVPISAPTGRSWLPGGICIQWGQGTTNSSGNSTITFAPAFGTFFTALLTRIETSSDNRGFVQFTAIPNNMTGQVKMRSSSGSSIAGDYLWLAIGSK